MLRKSASDRTSGSSEAARARGRVQSRLGNIGARRSGTLGFPDMSSFDVVAGGWWPPEWALPRACVADSGSAPHSTFHVEQASIGIHARLAVGASRARPAKAAGIRLRRVRAAGHSRAAEEHGGFWLPRRKPPSRLNPASRVARQFPGCWHRRGLRAYVPRGTQFGGLGFERVRGELARTAPVLHGGSGPACGSGAR